MFSPECGDVEVLGATVDEGSKRTASSVSAFTLLRWMDSVRKSKEKNRKPSWLLQLRLRRFVFRLLGGPMICVGWLRVALQFWLFTLCFFTLFFIFLLYFENLCVGEWVCLWLYSFFSALATKPLYISHHSLPLLLLILFAFFWDSNERKILFSSVCLLCPFYASLVGQKK